MLSRSSEVQLPDFVPAGAQNIGLYSVCAHGFELAVLHVELSRLLTTIVLTALRSVGIEHHVAPLGFSFQDSSPVPSQKSRDIFFGQTPTRTRSPQDHRDTSTQLPRSWKQSTQKWATNKLYGLSLPKHVVSNRLTREQGIAGMDIFEVPLSKVVSGDISNWALRQVAHGRTVQWENFRSRQEAIFCGMLTRALRSDQAEQEGTDFVTILNASQKKFFPDSDLPDTPQSSVLQMIWLRSFVRKLLYRPIKHC